MKNSLFPFRELLAWYRANGRHLLPWRQYFHLSAKNLGYHVWLSEILLQQTQAERVIGYYDRILERFPTVESLAAASYEEFFPYYQGLGYYSRARNMLATAKIVAEDHGGIFPNDAEKLVKLPGVGPYTAAAIRAFVYDEPVLSFDTNLEKIFSRYYHGSRFHKLSREEKAQIEKDFRTTGISGREINAAFMDFGSLVSVNNASGFARNSPHPSPLLEGEAVKSSSWAECDDPEQISFFPPSSPFGSKIRRGRRGVVGDGNEDEGEKNYPLAGCKWFETKGALEVQQKKKKLIFPTKDASIRVVLHENHKTYYSSRDAEYQPFELPPTEGDIRHHVQEYFRSRYGLELSVRPVHDKFFENDRPFVVCNAQVQSGEIVFGAYNKDQARI